MEINLKFEYRDMTMEELENWLFRLQGLAGGKIYSITKIENAQSRASVQPRGMKKMSEKSGITRDINRAEVNSQPDERASYHASQSKSNKRDTGSPADILQDSEKKNE